MTTLKTCKLIGLVIAGSCVVGPVVMNQKAVVLPPVASINLPTGTAISVFDCYVLYLLITNELF